MSKHLKVLEGAGLLARRREGRVHRLRLVPRPLAAAARWIEDRRRFWEGTLERLDAATLAPTGHVEVGLFPDDVAFVPEVAP